MKDLVLNTDRMVVKSENGVGWMIFNQPKKRNAVSFDMWKSIPKIVNFFLMEFQLLFKTTVVDNKTGTLLNTKVIFI